MRPRNVTLTSATRRRKAGVSLIGQFIAVFIGGALGTAMRIVVILAIGLANPHSLGWEIAWVNGVGSFLLGVLVAGFWVRPKTPMWFKALIGPGFLGAFTTLSGMLPSALFTENMWFAPLYIGVNVGTSLLAALLGLWVGQWLGPRRLRSGSRRRSGRKAA